MSFILLDKIGLQCNMSKRKEGGSFCKIKAKKKKHLQFLKTVFIQKGGLQQLTVYSAVRITKNRRSDRFVNESVSCRGGKKHLLGFLCPVYTANMFMRKFITVHVVET